MSKRKSNKPIATQEPVAVQEPVEDEVEELEQFNAQQDALDAEQDVQLAMVKPVTKRTKESMRGRSQIVSPVAAVWAICNNAFVLARNTSTEPPSRKALFDLCVYGAKIAPYTARTQIQLYLKASNRGTQIPGKFPKGVSFDA